MDNLMWIGALISLVGMAGIVYCAVQVWKAKQADLGDEALYARIRAVMPINLASMFISVIGLMAVVVGILLR